MLMTTEGSTKNAVLSLVTGNGPARRMLAIIEDSTEATFVRGLRFEESPSLGLEAQESHARRRHTKNHRGEAITYKTKLAPAPSRCKRQQSSS